MVGVGSESGSIHAATQKGPESSEAVGELSPASDSGVDPDPEGRITAVIPTHNRPDRLMTAVQSVEDQTKRVALVVVDDGSTAPIQMEQLPDHAVLLRNDIALGSATARNMGVAAARTDWVAFLDDDDVWLPTKAEVVLGAARRFPDADVIVHSTAARSPGVGSIGPRLIENPTRRVLRRQPPHITGVTVRRSLHDEVRFDETMWATEDVDYLIRLALISNWVEIDQDLAFHGPRDGTAINMKSRIEGRLRLMEKHRELIHEDRASLSFYYARLGQLYLRALMLGDARRGFLAAIRVMPRSGLAWRGLARTILPSSLRGGYRS